MGTYFVRVWNKRVPKPEGEGSVDASSPREAAELLEGGPVRRFIAPFGDRSPYFVAPYEDEPLIFVGKRYVYEVRPLEVQR